MFRPSGIVALLIAALVAALAAAQATAAPPTCVTPPVQSVRPDVTTTVPSACASPPGQSPPEIFHAIVDPPDHGTVLAGAFGGISYAPFDGYTGPDAFVLASRNGDGYAAPVTYGIDVRADANRAPVCTAPKPAGVRADATLHLTIGCYDPDGDPVTRTVTSAPAHGDVTLGTLDMGVPVDYADYSPRQTGEDHFAVTVSDGRAETTQQYAVTVVGADAAGEGPVCADLELAWMAGGGDVAQPRCTDPEGDDVRLAIVGAPAHGTATADGGAITYAPAAGYTGPDTVTFRGVDDHAAGPERTLSVVVPDPTPRCPPADPITVRPGGSRWAFLPCWTGNSPIDPAVTDPPDHGTLTGSSGSYRYVADNGYTGDDTFTLTPSAGGVSGTPRTYAVSISPAVNAAPRCSPASVRAARGGAVVVPSGCSDEDDDAIAYDVTTPPAHGTLSDATPTQVTYTPAAGYAGTDAFDVRADDAHGGVVTVRHEVVVTAAGSNNPPYCAGGGSATPVDTPTTLMPLCSDSDGDSVTLAVVSGPAHGTLNGTTYTPAPGFTGTDAVVFRPSDPSGPGPRTRLTIWVGTSISTIHPACGDIGTTVVSGATRRVTLACGGSITEPTSYEVVGAPAHGTTGAVGAGHVPYTAPTGFTGTDTFTYRAAFYGPTFTPPATVTVDVRAPQPADPGDTGTTPADPTPPPAPPASPSPTAPSTVTPPVALPRVPSGFTLLRGLGSAQLAVPARAVGVRRDARATIGILQCPSGCTLRWSTTLIARAARAAANGSGTVVRIGPHQQFVMRARFTAAQRRAIKHAPRPTVRLKLRLRDGTGVHAVTRTIRLKK